MSCRSIGPLLDAFVDGELPPERVLEVEQHLVDCHKCSEREHLSRAMKLSLQRTVREAAPITAEFHARIAQALAAEREREMQVDHLWDHTAHRKLSWRSMPMVAAAAAATLVWAASANRLPSKAPAAGRSNYAMKASTVDELLEQLVDYHLRAPSPQVTEPALLRQFEPEVGVPLRPPSLLDYGVRWEGGSVVPVNNQRAASLRYRMGDHRVTLYVYNSSRFPIESQLKRRVVRQEPVYVGVRRGFSIAAREHYGVGYAIASDLNPDESAELVAAIY